MSTRCRDVFNFIQNVRFVNDLKLECLINKTEEFLFKLVIGKKPRKRVSKKNIREKSNKKKKKLFKAKLLLLYYISFIVFN